MIEIMDMNTTTINEPYDVIVDRRSVLGNPYYMYDESYRDDVCNKYKIWFDKQVNTNEEVQVALGKLIELYNQYDELRLFCWCAPKRCHAETIKKWIEDLKNPGE